MFLQEEYFNRHQITDVPFVYYIKKGTVLFKSNPFLLMLIFWKEDENHPGRYHIFDYKPVSNGYLNKNYFKSEAERILSWEEYYVYLVNLLGVNTLKSIVNDDEIKLAIWEIFLYCFDKWISDTVNNDFKELINKSVNLDFSERLIYYNQCIIYLERHYSKIFNIFKFEIIGFVRNYYCYWLGNLFRKNLRNEN